MVTAADTEVAAPTDDELKKFYEENPQTYTAPEYRSIVAMKADPADIAAKIIVSDAELQSNYEKYKLDYRDARNPRHRTDRLPQYRRGEKGQGPHRGG